ncbi:hypothetical protein [Ehrlichia ruminantium]|uniref:Uncharacterized protein n=1 Tax=Ehrlichia ruminantium TaxID=779 RepID=A0A170TDH3_EHRRU|nr:hypothetical protein [Ehrlichia ruminantium]GAT78786.1 hypothetical protein EHRUM3_10160 [Ehrlichia ruminantium]
MVIDCESSSDGEYSSMRYSSESEDGSAIDRSINEIVIQYMSGLGYL